MAHTGIRTPVDDVITPVAGRIERGIDGRDYLLSLILGTVESATLVHNTHARRPSELRSLPVHGRLASK